MRALALSALLLLGAACYRIPAGFDPGPHIVYVDEDGGMRASHDTAQVRLTGRYAGDVLDDSSARRAVGVLMQRIRESGQDTITLYVHGGLVTYGRARADAARLGTVLQRDGHFPLFVAWESGWFPTFADHVKSVRQGQEWAPVMGWLTAPLIIAADLGRAVARAPLGIFQQAADYCATWRGALSDSIRQARGDHSCRMFADEVRVRRQNVRRALDREVAGTSTDSLHLTLGEYHSTLPRSAGRTVSAYVTALPKALVSGPLMDGFGAGTYENMLRRTQTMFRQHGDMARRAPTTGYREPTGATAILMDSLAHYVAPTCDSAGRCRVSLNLVGHSMGSIVVARMLREWPELPVRNIYFMAAAATVTDVETSVIPYLRTHPTAAFYNGMLHPRIEVGEAQWVALDLVPRGSLLEWIDDHLTAPQTPLDRTAGKWDNMAAMEYIFPPEVRARVLLKGFGFRDPRDATSGFLHRKVDRHSAFDDPRFAWWRDGTWCIYVGAACVPARDSTRP
jgi:pimeloyl-ACP methyl ester carboxylesterase